MTEKIDKTLRKLAAGISKGNSPTTSSTEPENGNGSAPAGQPAPTTNGRRYEQPEPLAGDPNCPLCGGLGFLRRDLPVGHPDFGKLEICSCRSQDVSQQVRARLFALSNLNELSHLTFENFLPRGRVGLWPQQADSLERAFNQANHFSQNMTGWLVFQGGYGCGKTHLAAAIANYAVELGVPALFITVPDMLDSLRFAYQDPEATFEQRFEEIRAAPLLILDDFGTQNATAWAQEKLFQILNYRYINHLPLVVTTNLALDEIEERIASRLMDPDIATIVRILAPDFRQPTGDMGHPAMSSLGLLHGRTFASFDLRRGEGLDAEELKNLEKGLRVARDFAEQPAGWLVLMGPYGCGKTHLAAAIANFRADLGYPPLFVVVPDLLDHLRATFNPNSSTRYDRVFEEVRTAKLLILDDLGTQSMTPWVREKLYQIFNYRYNGELPTVITTADTLDEIDPRLRSRLLDRRLCTIYALTVPGYGGAGQSRERRAAASRRKPH